MKETTPPVPPLGHRSWGGYLGTDFNNILTVDGIDAIASAPSIWDSR